MGALLILISAHTASMPSIMLGIQRQSLIR